MKTDCFPPDCYLCTHNVKEKLAFNPTLFNITMEFFFVLFESQLMCVHNFLYLKS